MSATGDMRWPGIIKSGLECGVDVEVKSGLQSQTFKLVIYKREDHPVYIFFVMMVQAG